MKTLPPEALDKHIALAQCPSGLTRRQLGVRAGLSSSSGTFSTYLGGMRGNAWIEEGGDKIRITDKGINDLGEYTPLPSGSALRAFWQNELGGGASRMLSVLADAYPRALSRMELGAAANIVHTSGTFSTYLGKLRTLELVEGTADLTASADLI